MFFPDSESSLPINGWLQYCLICDSITGNTIKFDTMFEFENYIVEAFVCKKCAEVEKNINKIKRLSPKYIKDLLNQTHQNRDV